MTLDEAFALVKSTEQRMNEIYRKPVFDEWAIVTRADDKILLLRYSGPRRETFHRSFDDDTRELREQYRRGHYAVGDYEFNRQGPGTKVEAFIVSGEGVFVLCNHTARSMAEIAADPLWLGAQVPFIELCEKFCADPLVYP